jgi:ornithine--oxo-acid transaminase
LSATGEYQQQAHRLGLALESGLRTLVGHGVDAVRCRGLWAGVDLDPDLMTGREASHRLLERGVLVKDTHGSTVRIAPPLVVTDADIEILLEAFAAILR